MVNSVQIKTQLTRKHPSLPIYVVVISDGGFPHFVLDATVVLSSSGGTQRFRFSPYEPLRNLDVAILFNHRDISRV